MTPLFTPSAVIGYLGCFHLLAVMNSAAVNACVQVFVATPVVHSLGLTCFNSQPSICFLIEETEAQRDETICLWSHCQQGVAESDLTPGSPTPGSISP